MITVKLGELRFITESLNKIMEEKLPIKAAYSFSKLGKKIQKEIESFEESRAKLLERYCVRDENAKPVIENNQYKIADQDGFAKDFAELAEIEVEIDFEPIPIDKLGDIQISPVHLIRLDRFIAE